MRVVRLGAEFLVCDSRELLNYRRGRYIIFTTERNLSYLQASDTWFADGIFHVREA